MLRVTYYEIFFIFFKLVLKLSEVLSTLTSKSLRITSCSSVAEGGKHGRRSTVSPRAPLCQVPRR